MKAAVYTQYGPPEVVHWVEVPDPRVKPDQVLVRVHATTVNRNDCGFRKPEYPWIIRPIQGLFRPKRQILGTEFSGTILAVGAKVTQFKAGDEVFGLTGNDFGTHAEKLVIRADSAIALKPKNLTHEKAVAICDGPWLAYNLYKKLEAKSIPGSDKKIVINGASGSIGSSFLQLAKNGGWHVTAVASTRSLDIIRSLGADLVMDYAKQDFHQLEGKYDAVVDAVGKSSFHRCKHLIRDQGFYFSTELGDWFLQNPLLALWTPIRGGVQVRFPIPVLNQSEMKYFAELAEAGKLKPVIDRTYSADQIVEAYRFVETEQKIGSVVVQITEGLG
ncbi:MAG: NAD(P)-dependent alcohol dehydrogenase [Bdellovibrionales bacterium]|nr:NAD(P)-dependent alcohol dehydrogenase [Bdellovibrionales bacterium]